MSKIKDAADSIKAVAEAVPIYQDLLQPAMKELGKGVHTIAKTVNIALSPVSAMVWGYDQIKDFVQSSLERKLANVPKENIIPPDLTIAGPALEALRYTGHKEELREMFSNLLATSMDKNTASKAHPSFVEIIKQINSDEAKIIKYLTSDSMHPQVSIQIVVKNGYSPYYQHFSTIPFECDCEFPNLGNTYLNNLHRLGLVIIKDETYLTDESRYEPLEKHELIQKLISDLSNQGYDHRINKGILERTSYGKKFFDSCVTSK